MRYMLIVKANKKSEAGILPTAEDFECMHKFNQELVNAGVLLAAEGLTASAQGVRIRQTGTKRTVIDGPFAETKELVAGFWLLQVKSKEEAIEWAKRVPSLDPDGDSELELRRVAEPEDFGDAFTPESREQIAAMRARVAGRKADT